MVPTTEGMRKTSYEIIQVHFDPIL
jgi:hypothetical protein